MYKPLLAIKNLQIDFVNNDHAATAVKSLSLEVNRGEIVAIVGESGSGKSVTALSILQLLAAPPARYVNGQILFTDRNERQTDLLKASPEYMRQIRGNEIAMVFQDPMTSLNPVQSCGRQVMEAIVVHQRITSADAKKQVLALFETVQLPSPALIFDRYPHQLSGGQKQRVVIAMAVCCQPSLLLCDEPTTALDVTVQKTILRLIKTLQQAQNMGVIFITHDLGVVAEIADKVVVMYKGEVVEQGTAHQIYTAPAHPYTKALLACRPALNQKADRLPLVSDFMEVMPNGSIREKPVTLTKPFVIAEPSPIISTIDPKPVLLSVKNLYKTFTQKKNWLSKTPAYTHAVNDVSFEVFEGETLGLAGESGCGKTTLGRTIIRLTEPSAGEIWYKGRNLLTTGKQEMQALRKDMQIIFQDPYGSLNPRLTVGAAIAEPLLVHGICPTAKERKEYVMDMLQKVDLPTAFYYRFPHEFSGGQRQRIVIARALALRPSFVICDESVSALDVSVQAQVLNLLNDLKKSFGFTTIFISHDLSVVKHVSDRIMIMQKGKIVETGDPETIYHHPKSTYTRQLITAIPGGVFE